MMFIVIGGPFVSDAVCGHDPAVCATCRVVALGQQTRPRGQHFDHKDEGLLDQAAHIMSDALLAAEQCVVVVRYQPSIAAGTLSESRPGTSFYTWPCNAEMSVALIP